MLHTTATLLVTQFRYVVTYVLGAPPPHTQRHKGAVYGDDDTPLACKHLILYISSQTERTRAASWVAPPSKFSGLGVVGLMPRRPLSAARACHFQDSDGNCWQPDGRGICGPPAEGAAALIQHANQKELCRFNPPMGVKPLCQGKDQVSPAEGLELLRKLRDPARCRYRSCAVVGAGGTLLGARLGAEIDSHEAVIRINLTPDGPMAAEGLGTPHRHVPTWIADVGARTSWRVVTMEVYGSAASKSSPHAQALSHLR